MNDKRPEGALPDVPKLLASAARLCGRDVQLAAIDMPLAYTPICGRRTSDNDLSRAYGARKCGTHTPSVTRPGTLSTLLREAFDLAGYPLLTTPQPRGLIEVYPHPALVELAQASMRLPYKVSKVKSYWPSATPSERRTHLFAQWTLIEDLLERELSGIAAALPTRQRLANTADQSLRGHTRRHCVYVDWNLHTRRTSETVRR